MNRRTAIIASNITRLDFLPLATGQPQSLTVVSAALPEEDLIYSTKGLRVITEEQIEITEIIYGIVYVVISLPDPGWCRLHPMSSRKSFLQMSATRVGQT